MKKFFILILAIMFIFSACTVSTKNNTQDVYIKSVWFTYYDLQSLMSKDKTEFTNNIKNAFNKVKNMGFNTVTVQVRPFADAFYKSKYFPSSKYCFGKQGSEMFFDPLQIICIVAKSYNLNVEAWINPYRVSSSENFNSLSKDNIALKWKNTSKIFVKKGIYFNPASKDVTNLIVNGVKEIVSNYDIYSIHFDDYFYPTTSKKIDKTEYADYKEGGGTLSLANWRRQNVSNMVKTVYKTVKSINSNVKFGISPAANIDNDYNNLYADVKLWCSSSGYVDYICPQIYFGFKNTYQPFMQTVKKWCSIANCDLYVGLPLYKCGKADEYADECDKDIINEFKNNDNIISRQITYLSKISQIKGYYIFSYSDINSKACKAEIDNMITVMQNSSQQ